MFYAVCGIPIMLLCLTNLGNIMAKTFRFVYRSCHYCCKRKNYPQQKVSTRSVQLENANANQQNGQIFESSDVFLNVNEISADDSYEMKSLPATTQSRPKQSRNASPRRTQSVVVVEAQEEAEDYNRVPIWLVAVLVVSYITGGGFMFKTLEDWRSLLDGIYFCFISLSTIGFGDLVPQKTLLEKLSKTKINTDKDQFVLMAVCIYLVFGLALLAMSFSLVQEEILLKCRRIARRIGITSQTS
ncbi:TWiK family of potassium channels protein 18-like protein [Dinothrombium tinctorium]|uniref:TWiK family of potassium channels protein 18-like protein n=1 Tax=Dinothrombium tinctorium TaxID=1965070 RepID=A0A3S3P225_9ACAR|nr:TWiK family of potassium channels protein 18-like protein [Dinothrombium tinctorium]